MTPRWADQVAVVTGTAQGIGAAVAESLEAAGATVHRVDRDRSPAPAPSAGRVYVVDLSRTDEVDDLFADVGHVDVLVNSAGGVVGQTHVPFGTVLDADWDAVLDANLRTTMLCTRAAVRSMTARGYGRVVTISSGAGRSVSLTGIQAYAAAKAAQIALTRQLAHELGPQGVTVNCVAPGFVLSNPTTQRQWEALGPDGQEALVRGIAVRRTGSAGDIARAVLFFADPAAGWVSGQTLSVDGGSALF
ncbi:SDR family NAD(P)-dependent oxidoreductase [Lapillicoccus jejuensis]|uniref:3-oxoacyl-[acyl-carrier protein] reductase n=1 Tax=Lapillicoccus jejuensis TaxID=402171 RepID=A0A542E403_9MICO|nr:SDR family oxidoreductase [Lapillicoccus jejuensis]TQJ09984.1 3-oxoacyl-[acyl-carrier protein] reductase [Lapillicoccus jejuensis]